MIIKTKSWHYRFINFFKSDFSPMPTTVCSYTFSFVKSVLFTIGAVGGSLLVFLGLGSINADAIICYYSINMASDSIEYMIMSILIGIPTLISMLTFAFCVAFLIEKSQVVYEYFTNKIKQYKISKSCKEIQYEESNNE